MNQIMVIFPYRYQESWVFDDEQVGLVREPFVSGIPEIIDAMVGDVPDAGQGFKLLFSAEPFPGYQVRLDWVREELGGNWYRWAEQNLEGWLCPALFNYFEESPPRLFCRGEPKGRN